MTKTHITSLPPSLPPSPPPPPPPLSAKVQVSGVERWPSSVEGQRLNTERALEFLEADGVSLHLEACRGEWSVYRGLWGGLE